MAPKNLTSVGLEEAEIRYPSNVVWNASTSELYEHIIRRDEGEPAVRVDRDVLGAHRPLDWLTSSRKMRLDVFELACDDVEPSEIPEDDQHEHDNHERKDFEFSHGSSGGSSPLSQSNLMLGMHPL